jgi:hypothetical protein
MRVYPQRLKDLMVRSTPEVDTETAHLAPAAEQGDGIQRPIVSINGQDVPESELAKKRSA